MILFHFFLFHPLQPILWRNNSLFLHIIRRKESIGELGVGSLGIPLHLKERELTIAFLYVVNLLLLVGAPEITIHVSTTILISLDTLANEEVFP